MRHLVPRLLFVFLLLGFLGPAPLCAEDPAPPADPASEDGEEPKAPPPVLHKDPDQPDTPEAGTETKPTGRVRMVEEWTESPLGVPAPAGMVYVPAGQAVIGTPLDVIEKLLTGRTGRVKGIFAFEAPQHTVPVNGFFIGRYEVTNAQYLAYLKDRHAVEYKTVGQLANLDEIAAYLLPYSFDVVSAKKSPYTKQLYLANKDLLHEAMPQLVVKAGESPDPEAATYRKFRRAPLPRGLILKFYHRTPPWEWQALEPSEAMLDLPVRNITYVDAEEFCEWAGVRMPTEIEWEYAARGPEGYIYPWGDIWYPDVQKANWGGKIVNARYHASPIPVDGNPPAFVPNWPEDELKPYDGMSWCGVWHLIGNVGEWTSSWFDAYAGCTAKDNWMGTYVKVLKGGTYADSDSLILRAAVRNFKGSGMKQPPQPQNRFEKVGFRLAWSGNPGQDQLEPILYRVAKGKRVKRRDLALNRWAGAASTKFAPKGAKVEHHVYFQGRAHSIVLVPRISMFKDDDKTAKIKRRKDLAALGKKQKQDPIPLALFHTDVGLTNVYIRDREKAKEAKGGRRRRKVEAPPVKRGKIPPGDYLLAYWFDRICLTDPSLDFVCFFTLKSTPKSTLDIKTLEKGETLAPTQVAVEAAVDSIEIDFSLPVGGAKNKANTIVVVRTLLLESEEGALTKAGEWKTGRAKQVPMPGQQGQAKPKPEDKPKGDGEDKPEDEGKPKGEDKGEKPPESPKQPEAAPGVPEGK